MERIADVLVLRFTRGVTLRDWSQSGLLDRELELYRGLAGDFGGVVFVTDGDRADAALAKSMGLRLVCDLEGLGGAAYDATVADTIARMFPQMASAVVKTNQMVGGLAALRIARGLRSKGIRCGLVARGGYLHSKFMAYEHGADSKQAREAAEEERELCLAADVVVGSSVSMLNDLAWRHCLSESRVVLEPNYVLDADPAYASHERASHELLYAGQLVRRKRVDMLIDALSRLPEAMRRETRLSLIGEGPQKVALEQQASKLSLNVRFEPRLPHRDLLGRMRRCTVFVCASELEGHPKAVIEAMGAGAPVVACDAPGLGEVIEHGTNGLRVAADPEVLARTIEVLLGDEELRRAMGKKAAGDVRDRYALKRTLEIERGVLGRAARSAGSGVERGDRVKFESSLVGSDLKTRVSSWGSAIEKFASRFGREDRAAFLLGLESPLRGLQREAVELIDPSLVHGEDREAARGEIGSGRRIVGVGSVREILEIVGGDADVRFASLAAGTRARANLSHEAARAGVESCRVLPAEADVDEEPCDVLLLVGALETCATRIEGLASLVERLAPSVVIVRAVASERDWRVGARKALGIEWRLDNKHIVEFDEALLCAELAAAGLDVSWVSRRGEHWWAGATPAEVGVGGDASVEDTRDAA